MTSVKKTPIMNRITISLIILITTITITSACTPSTKTPNPTTAETITASPSPSESPTLFWGPTTLEGTTLSLSEGPLLLVQTDFGTYHIIDIGQDAVYPFEPPVENKSFDLRGNLSPSGQRMLFPTEEQLISIMNFKTWEIQNLDNINDDSPVFQLQLAAEEALEALPQSDFTFQNVLSAVNDAFVQSHKIHQWYQDDNTLLNVQTGTPSSTNLLLYNLESDIKIQLESQPGLVQAFWVAPGGDKILIKKGFIFDPNVWQDDRYVVVDLKDQSVTPLPLPRDSDYPSLSWLNSNEIGITHQIKPNGGVGYSIVNLSTMESTLILDGAFTQIRGLGNNLLATFQNKETKTTKFQRLNSYGEVIHSQSLDCLCRIVAVVNGKIILNCESESQLMDENLLIQSFADPILLLNLAPDGESMVIVTREGKSFLLNAALDEWQSLPLTGSPLEIRWMPDSSGFLYRTLGELHYFNLKTEQSRLLYTSDLFGDYTNLNAVWINVE